MRGCRIGKCGNAILKNIRVFGNPAELNEPTDFGEPPAASGALASVPFGASDAYAAMGGNANDSSCAQRYRSYDPALGTFLGYDGRRHPCE